MNGHEPGISYPRGRDDWMRDHPLASRLLIMLGAFALLVPIGLVIRNSKGNVVRAGGLPGAALAADPLIVASTTTTPSASAGAAATTTPAPASPAAGASAASAPATASTATPATASPQRAAETVAAATTAAKTPPSTAKKAPATSAPATTAAQRAPATTVKKAVATTAAPKPTTPPTTKAPATTAPKATAPPTTAAPPVNHYSAAEVETIIRSVFPADQADEAVRVASRESHLVPTARNWCCYGLFQIYFKANQSTLAAIGITSAEQLFDPTLNAEAAYMLYQRNGWAPWQ
jgi:hypothetical protein